MFTDPTIRAAHIRRLRRDIAILLGCLALAGASIGAAVVVGHDLVIGRRA